MKILNFGSMNIDYVYQVSHMVEKGETLKSSEQNIYCGGKGLNQSIALANAGAKVYHAGLIGSDGDVLTDKLEEHGVDTSLVKYKPCKSSHTIIQVTPEGDNGILFFCDKELTLEEGEIEELLEPFTEGDYLLVQNEMEQTCEVIRAAKEKGMKVVLNPSPFHENILSFPLDCIDIFMMNEIEGHAFTGHSEPEYILEAMHESYPGAVIILTLGEKGAYCLAEDKVIIQAACAADPVDTTAAGDTFTGFFLAEYLRTEVLETALAMAAKAAAITVTLPGAADSIPMLSDMTE